MSRRRSFLGQAFNKLEQAAKEERNKRLMQEIMISNNYPPSRQGFSLMKAASNLSKFLDEEGNLIEGGLGSGLALSLIHI